MALSNDFTNQNIEPASELAAAYNDLKAFFTFKGMDFFQSIETKTAIINPINLGKTRFMSVALSREGSFYTEDLFGKRNLAQSYDLKPLNYTGNRPSGDISCYGCLPTKDYNEKEIYNDLFKFIGLKETTPVAAPTAPTGQNVTPTTTTTPTDIPAAQPEERETTAEKVNSANESSYNDIICNVINKSPTTPDALTNPHVSVYRYANPYMSISTSASDYCNVFFNAIDSINMSLCVPYVKINFIDRMSKKEGTYPSMSLVAFLKQSTNPDVNDKIFYNAKPILRDANDRFSKKILEGSVLGMESFLSPGTLLPDPTDVLSNPRILDPSVPLMSLEGLSINFKNGNTAAFSTRVANLSITLHDRSRMKDMSTILRPTNWSYLYCEIEWGWIHPHAAPQFNNPVARYLNALRVKNIFATTMMNMSITSGNSANISIDLTEVGAKDSLNGSVYDGNYIKKSYAIDLLDGYIKSKIAGDVTKIKNSITNIMPVTHMQISNERLGTQVKREFLTKIMTALNSENGLTDAEDQKLMDELTQIVTQSENRSNNDLARQKELLLRKINVNGFGKETFDMMRSRYAGLDPADYISVGAFLTTYIAMPLASLGLYDEVQIHTFCFNKGAGMIGGRPISDACIKIADIITDDFRKNDSIAHALSKITTFLSDPNLPTYGNVSLSTPVTKGSDKSADVASVDAQVDLKSQRDAAITGAETTVKTMPNIANLILTQPARVFDEKSDNIAKQAISQPDKKVLQIILYDKNESANMSEIVKAYDYAAKRRPAEFSGPSLTNDQAKELSKIAYPSLVYGATNSVIESINVSTQIIEALQTQSIIDSAKPTLTENSQSESLTDITDITVMPGTVTVSLLGMPYLQAGQQLYLDMGTGTSLDNVYVVTSVGHNLKGMKFNTSISMNQIGQGILTNVNGAIRAYRESLNNSVESVVSDTLNDRNLISPADAADTLSGLC